MPKGLFYSSITGKALENPVVFDGWLCDEIEANKITSLTDPVLDSNNNIIERPTSSTARQTYQDLAWAKTALLKFNNQYVYANFLKPVLDAAYDQSAWPRPSALRQNAMITDPDSIEIASRPEVMRDALSALFGDTIKKVTDNGLGLELSVTPKNKQQAEVLNRYGVINKPEITTGTDPKIKISGLDLKKLITEAESARHMMLNMRRVLMNKPKNLVMTDDVKLQQKCILTLDMLDKPLVLSGKIQETASVEDALALLSVFAQVQAVSTSRVYNSGDNAFAWHALIAENENHNGLDKYIKPFEAKYAEAINPFKTEPEKAEDVIAVIHNGELARMVLKQILPLSEKQEDMGFDWVPGHDWSSEVKAQREMISKMGALKNNLEETFLNQRIPNGVRLERAKIFMDAAQAIFAISKGVLNQNARIIKPKAGEQAWHQMITHGNAEKLDITEMYRHVQGKASGIPGLASEPTFSFRQVVNPFAEFEMNNPQAIYSLSTCSLNKQPTDTPVIFLDGYVYDGNALHQYLSAGNTTSPVTGEDFKAVIGTWSLDHLSQILPVSRPLIDKISVQIDADQRKDTFQIPSAPPMEQNGWNRNTISYPKLSDANNHSVSNSFGEVKGLLPVDAACERQGNVVTIKPTNHPYDGYTGTYDYYDYDGKEIQWKDLGTSMKPQLDYLKKQGIIADYVISPDSTPTMQRQITLYGFSEANLLAQANGARELLRDVKRATTTDDLFVRRIASIPLIKSAERAGMNALQDNGQLPDHVFYQHRNIVGESSRLSKQTRDALDTPIDGKHMKAAFECLAAAKEVITFGSQGARNNHTSYLRPLTYLRTDMTRQWFSIFQSNIEKHYEAYGHAQTTREMPYDFTTMAMSVRNWIDKHAPKSTASTSNTNDNRLVSQ